MFFKVLLCVTLATLSYGAPQEHHAISYVSTNLAGHGNLRSDDFGLGSHDVHLSAPITYTKHVPIIVKKEEKYEEEDHGHAKYEFHYAVEDKHTGDIKSQKESRHGDVVKGEYSLKEADGTTRTVKYSADKKSGFNAIVIREGHAAHPHVEEKKVEVKNVLVPIVQHHNDYHGFISHY